MTTKATYTWRRPPFWLRMSIPAGNLVQLSGLGLGSALLYLAAHTRLPRAVRVLLMLKGWGAIYVCCHAIAHWAVGRLVGVEFRGYGLRGTDHPHVYPPGVRQIMSRLPLFTAITRKGSLQQVSPPARAAMLSAGQASTAICPLLAAWYARQSGTPGGRRFFAGNLVLSIFLTVITTVVPEGDFARARAALRG